RQYSLPNREHHDRAPGVITGDLARSTQQSDPLTVSPHRSRPGHRRRRPCPGADSGFAWSASRLCRFWSPFAQTALAIWPARSVMRTIASWPSCRQHLIGPHAPLTNPTGPWRTDGLGTTVDSCLSIRTVAPLMAMLNDGTPSLALDA